MKILDHFSIPYQGLKNGMHRFIFDVDDAFFNCFENSIIQNGKFKVELELDKRPDLAIANFECSGVVICPCDRCLADFEHEMDLEFSLHIKYGIGNPDDDEVIYITIDTSHINFAQSIYEYITINLPMIKAHENIEDCDQDIINKLKDKNDQDDEDSIWSSLKGLKLDN
jgi:uncharacterized metal-binding protein YceD (DUF177 family)